MSDLCSRKVYLGFPEYCDLVRRLVQNIADCPDFQVQQVIAIARGGLFPGEVLSRVFEAPLAIVSVGSYPDKGTQQEEVVFSRDLTTKDPLVRTGVLLVDELTQSGLTLAGTVRWLERWYGLTGVRTAAIWHKDASIICPDFYVELVRPEQPSGPYPWFVTPQEQRDLWLPRP
ncbi:MAG: phosphoribosyltransferase family protein [Patescibacteria group bacterium]|jgi:hypothetical protein